tara:strand:+ start:83563 stop:83751 length:189 start_codon:yes stop_codon:yes gene_type:complete
MPNLNLKPVLNWKFYIWLVVAIVSVLLVTPFTVVRWLSESIEGKLNNTLTKFTQRLSNWVKE